jgi:Ca2+-binding RTX toxin-like protein
MTSFPIRLALTAALAAIAALVLPTAAGATVQSEVNGSTLTLTSNVDSDTITLAAAGGVITVNGVATAPTLAAGDTAEIVVNASGGADTVDASALAAATYGALTINGGDGDDLLIGGADADTLDGALGDDRLVGFKNTVPGKRDLVSGGEGDDVMVWNNGDGSDFNDGDLGNDEVEVNGAPTLGDLFTALPGVPPNGGQLKRINLVTFAVDFIAERLTVNGLGGDDNLITQDPPGLAGLTSLTVNGGTGNDNLFGGDGTDAINGGDGSDALFGGGGNDRLAGDRGADSFAGENGDDTLVWNNGDGGDEEEGGNGFDRVEVNGSPTAGDQFTVKPDAAHPGRVLFARANLVPFTLTLLEPHTDDDGIEALAVNGGAGDDQLTASPGLPGILVAADGGSDNDALTGSGEDDSFAGGTGNDTLTPGGGPDLVDGGAGQDLLLTRDATPDLVHGGPDTDRAQTDSVTVDAIDGVERLDATPAPPDDVTAVPPDDRAALLPTPGKGQLTRSHRKLVARIRVSCPIAEAGGCHTTLTLETAKPVQVGRVRAVLVLGSTRVELGPGQGSTVSIRLAGAFGHERHGKLPMRVRIESQDAAGNHTKGTVVIGLRTRGS